MTDNLLIKSFSVDCFRGLNNLKLNDLSRINVLVGPNNSGKTSVLEAVKLFSEPNNIGQMVRLALQRAQVSAEARKKNLANYMLSIFQLSDEDDSSSHYRIGLGANVNGQAHSYEADGMLSEIVDSTGLEKKSLQIAVKTSTGTGKANWKYFQFVNDTNSTYSPIEEPTFRAMYLHSTINYYKSSVSNLSNYIVTSGKGDILSILKTFDKNIDDLSIVGEDIYIHNTLSGSMPLFAYGSGLQKALFLTIAIAYCKNGVVLIDEIDNAIHVSAFEQVFSWFLNACSKWNIQAFVTTHSAEAIDAILSVAHNQYSSEDILRIITLRKDYQTNITKCKVRNATEAYEDRQQFRMELRV